MPGSTGIAKRPCESVMSKLSAVSTPTNAPAMGTPPSLTTPAMTGRGSSTIGLSESAEPATVTTVADASSSWLSYHSVRSTPLSSETWIL